MRTRKVNKTKQTLIYIATMFIAFGNFLGTAVLNLLNAIRAFYVNMADKFSPKVGKTFAWIILILTSIIVICGIIFGIHVAVKAYNEEMERQYIIQSNIEEQARIEAEKEAKRLEEEAKQ